MAGSKRKIPTRDTSSYGDQAPPRQGGFGSALSHGQAGRRALQQWSDGMGSPNHRPPMPNALRQKPKNKGK
jgi:hypothetical protein